MPILESAVDRSPTRRLPVNGSWKLRVVLGLVFGIPSSLGAQVSGLRWAPHGVAAIVADMVVGLLIALVAYALFMRTRTPNDGRSPILGQPSGADNAKSESCSASTAQQRLVEEKARLEDLDAERERRGDSSFGKTTEDRIVWGELLELELQDIDERVSRIRQTAGRAAGRPSRMPPVSNAYLRKGGPHELNDR